MTNAPDDWIGVPETAALCGRPEATLRSWRLRNQGPPSYKLVGCVMYRRGEVLEWIAAQRADIPA